MESGFDSVAETAIRLTFLKRSAVRAGSLACMDVRLDWLRRKANQDAGPRFEQSRIRGKFLENRWRGYALEVESSGKEFLETGGENDAANVVVVTLRKFRVNKRF